jgi:hypothetical protein
MKHSESTSQEIENQNDSYETDNNLIVEMMKEITLAKRISSKVHQRARE